MRTRDATAVLALGGAMLVATACSGNSNGSSSADAKALREQVCTQADLGTEYRQETAGDFSPGNLAGLASNADQRKKALDAAGLKDGYFAYWKHNVGDPPFDPPNEVVCQVMEFGTDAEAAAFVASMQPTVEELVTTAIAWIPGSNRKVTEEQFPGSDLKQGRAFHLTASDSNVSVSLYVVVIPDGRYVRSVYTGGQDSKSTVADAVAIEATIAARVP